MCFASSTIESTKEPISKGQMFHAEYCDRYMMFQCFTLISFISFDMGFHVRLLASHCIALDDIVLHLT